jgi:hypothetical protein
MASDPGDLPLHAQPPDKLGRGSAAACFPLRAARCACQALAGLASEPANLPPSTRGRIGGRAVLFHPRAPPPSPHGRQLAARAPFRPGAFFHPRAARQPAAVTSLPARASSLPLQRLGHNAPPDPLAGCCALHRAPRSVRAQTAASLPSGGCRVAPRSVRAETPSAPCRGSVNPHPLRRAQTCRGASMSRPARSAPCSAPTEPQPPTRGVTPARYPFFRAHRAAAGPRSPAGPPPPCSAHGEPRRAAGHCLGLIRRLFPAQKGAAVDTRRHAWQVPLLPARTAAERTAIRLGQAHPGSGRRCGPGRASTLTFRPAPAHTLAPRSQPQPSACGVTRGTGLLLARTASRSQGRPRA